MHWIKHNKVKKCGAAKGAKLSSWLLPQGDYKWVEVIQSLIKKHASNSPPAILPKLHMTHDLQLRFGGGETIGKFLLI